jgi:HTH-type transcriptional regulator/antitoxin MqsA
MDERICPETGAVMSRGTRAMTLSYKGRSIVIEMPGWYAEGVEDGIHSGDDMKVSDRALHRLKAQGEGLLQPEDVRRIRRKLGLTQREAGLVIGGGRNAFQKYEAGDVMVGHAISSALRVLDAHPDALAILVAHRAERSAA